MDRQRRMKHYAASVRGGVRARPQSAPASRDRSSEAGDAAARGAEAEVMDSDGAAAAGEEAAELGVRRRKTQVRRLQVVIEARRAGGWFRGDARRSRARVT
jgi:hypothetical protein